MNTERDPIRAAAFEALSRGLCVIPPRQDGSKAPLGEWKKYQANRTTGEDLNRWYDTTVPSRLTGLGTLCGAVSGNLEAVEFDAGGEVFEGFKERAVATGLGELLERIEAGYSERSPSGGVHLLYRCDEIEGNQQLAKRFKTPDEFNEADHKAKAKAEEKGRTRRPTRVLIETRGEGGFIILAPTHGTVHPSGGAYELLRGGFSTIATITPEEREALWNLARSFNVTGDKPNDQAEAQAKDPRTNDWKDTITPWDDYNARTSWPALLVGWTLVFKEGETQYWRRPGKSTGTSASINLNGLDNLYVFTTSTDFEAQKPYAKFDAYALLEHRGDKKAAAKALAGLGYGTHKRWIKNGAESTLQIFQNPCPNGERIARPGDPPPTEPGIRSRPTGTRRPEADKGETQSQTLIRLTSDAELIRTAEGKAFARVPVAGHHEVHEINSKGFRNWLTRAFYVDQCKSPSPEVFEGTLRTLKARAQFDDNAKVSPVFVRVAPSGDGFTLDLGDDSWRTVEIMSGRWTVTENTSVYFRRPDGLRALPLPERGGRPEELLEFLNIECVDLPLVLAWMTAALLPRGPYPVLELAGEQGSAKSTTARLIRALLDPHQCSLRSEPKDVQDLMISATNGWLVAFDNLSWIPNWLSDALCRLSTGGGFATRELYTNYDEVFLDAQRPVILTGIDEVVRRNDLIDRTVFLSLPPIPETNRRTEVELWKDFDAKRARLLGMLLTVMADGLRKLPDIRLDGLPRMADFALWGEAVCQAAGFPPRAFLTQYQSNREAATEAVLEDSLVASALREFLWIQGGSWYGTAATLLSELNQRLPKDTNRYRGSWPPNPRSLSGHLRRLTPALRSAGVLISFGRGKTRKISIETEPEAVKPASTGNVPPIPVTDSRASGSACDREMRKPTSGDANDGTVAKTPTLTGEPARRRLVI